MSERKKEGVKWERIDKWEGEKNKKRGNGWMREGNIYLYRESEWLKKER